MKTNSAANGGSLHLLSCTVSVHDKNDIIGYKAKYGGAIFANNSVVACDYVAEVSLVVPGKQYS